MPITLRYETGLVARPRFWHTFAVGRDGQLETGLEIQHEEADGRGAFFVERDGKRIAEQAYRRGDAGHVTIVHTEVEPSLRRQGIARKLQDALVAWARATGTRVRATCSYARAQFEQDASIRDVFDG